jgi:uncharacterized membrane protein YccC
MIVLMILAYSFMRTKYIVFVMLMTPYILILFFLLNPHDFNAVVGDRLLDTLIGSVIAFLANMLIAPAWVQERFNFYLGKMIAANRNYFRDVAATFTGENVEVIQYKYSRKQAYVELANVTDALNRMLAEPRRKQKNPAEFHQFVVLNYMMTSHTATLASYARRGIPIPVDKDYLPVLEAVLLNLKSAELILENNNSPSPLTAELSSKEGLRKMNDRVTALIIKRKEELEQGIQDSPTRRQLTLVKSINDQFNFITKISEDLLKVISKWI